MNGKMQQLRKLSSLKKLESSPASVLGSTSSEPMLTAIVKVSDPQYVPAEIEVRARIDATLFTAELSTAQLSTLETDPKVVSVALSRPQRLIA